MDKIRRPFPWVTNSPRDCGADPRWESAGKFTRTGGGGGRVGALEFTGAGKAEPVPTGCAPADAETGVDAAAEDAGAGICTLPGGGGGTLGLDAEADSGLAADPATGDSL
jgi:hypothetical protein